MNTKKMAYGGVIFDGDGRVLLRKPTGEFDGYKWTFPKGRPNAGESPEEAALREVLEESGVKGEIICEVPGTFVGGTTDNRYYVMRPIEINLPFSNETEEQKWATYEEANNLISETTNLVGRKRDHAVLKASILAYEKTRP